VRATSGFNLLGDHAEVLFVNTLPSWQRRGIGIAMTSAALRAACDSGAGRARLDSSDAGLSTYLRLGFEIVGEVQRFTSAAEFPTVAPGDQPRGAAE